MFTSHGLPLNSIAIIIVVITTRFTSIMAIITAMITAIITAIITIIAIITTIPIMPACILSCSSARPACRTLPCKASSLAVSQYQYIAIKRWHNGKKRTVIMIVLMVTIISPGANARLIVQ